MTTRTYGLLLLLMLSGLARAELTQLDVDRVPAKVIYTQGDDLQLTARSDGSAPEYRYVLRRLSPDPAAVLATAWRPDPAFSLATGSVLTPAGKYRLVVKARESSNPDALRQQVIDFHIAPEADILAMLQARHAKAVEVLRAALRRVITRQRFGQDVTVDCYHLSDGGNLIEALLDPAGSMAPAGGPAFVAGPANAETGAVGVGMLNACADPHNWSGVEVALHLPAYLGLPATTVTVGYDAVLLPEEIQAQRDLVLQRYHDAIARTTAALRQVIRRQGNGVDLTDQFNDFQTTHSLIDNVLNPYGKTAPRGGNAYVEGQGGAALTGAVGVEMTLPPADVDDWWGVSVDVHLPAFLGLEPQSSTVAYASVLTADEQQAQRELVLARYERAVSEARQLFSNARMQLATYSRASAPYLALQDGQTFIRARLNEAAHAPRSGPAWIVAGAGDAKTGAVAIEVVQPPASARQWAGTALRVHLPAFPGLEAATTEIFFDE